jgi:hypothetical protein
MSPGTDTIIQNALERRNLQALFAALPLLRELDPQQLRDVSAEIQWFPLSGGATLFEAGQVPNGLYAVVNGALGSMSAGPVAACSACDRSPAARRSAKWRSYPGSHAAPLSSRCATPRSRGCP